MMSTRFVLLTSLAAALTGAVAPDPALAQQAMRTDSWRATTRSVEGLYTQYRFDTDVGSRVDVDGFGGRLMWSPAPATRFGGLAARSSVGLFAAYAPRQDGLNFSALHVGGQADVRPLAAPIFGRLDPVLSLGAGAFRTNVDATGAGAAVRVPLADRSNTTFALSPGVGARFDLGRGLALRGDVADVITFRGDTRHNVAVGAGLSLSF